jgi:hypothetical protein
MVRPRDAELQLPATYVIWLSVDKVSAQSVRLAGPADREGAATRSQRVAPAYPLYASAHCRRARHSLQRRFCAAAINFRPDSVRGPEERPPWFAHLLPLKRCCRLQACPARVRAPQVGFVSPLYIVMPRTVSATPSCEWARQRHWTAAGCGTRSWSPSRALAPISVAVGLGRLPSRRT